MNWPDEEQMVLMGSIRLMLGRIKAAHIGTPIAIRLPAQGKPAPSVIYGLPVLEDDWIPGPYAIELAPERVE